MFRAIRRLLLLLCVAVIAGGALLTLTGKPKLEDARRDVADEWSTIRSRLSTRYENLAVITEALRTSGRELAITEALSAAHSTWDSTSTSNTDSDAIARQISAANALEGVLRRVRGIVAASPRFSKNGDLTSALDRLSQTGTDPAQIEALNRSIDAANHERDGFLRRLVATALGYRDIPYFAGE